MLKHAFRSILLLSILSIALIACGGHMAGTETNTGNSGTSSSQAGQGMGMGMGNMSGGSMMARHHATIPAEYADLTNPIPADGDSIARGAEDYTTYCATCHGDGGMGDGPGASGLDPAPAQIAHTSQMMGDNYLYWRISEGGFMDPFNSVMPPWKGSLNEEARWDVINYMRALGQGTAQPGQMMGGAAFDPAVETAKHEAMVQNGLNQELIDAEEGEVFLRVHAEMDRLTAAGFANGSQGGMNELQTALLETLIAEKAITVEAADIFTKVHETLAVAGLME